MSYMDELISDVLGPPPSRGRKSKDVRAQFVREVTQEDINKLWSLPGGALGQGRTVQRLRHSHHYLARLLALGARDEEAHYATGYAISSISNLKRDPAFAALVAYYLQQAEKKFVDVHERIGTFSLDVLEVLQERLSDNAEGFSNRELSDLLELGLDRTGFGPTSNVKHSHLVAAITPEQMRRIRDEVGSRSASGVRMLGAVSAPEAPPDRQITSGPLLNNEPVADTEGSTELEGQGPDLSEEGGK